MIRFLSHRLRIDGTDYPPMSLLTIEGDGTLRTEPFTGECHSTTFVNGLLEVQTRDGEMPELMSGGRKISIITDGLNK